MNKLTLFIILFVSLLTFNLVNSLVYDEIDDSYINWSIWENNSIETGDKNWSVVENSDKIHIYIHTYGNGGTVDTLKYNLSTSNLPRVEGINNLTFLVNLTSHSNFASDNIYSFTRIFSFGNLIKEVSRYNAAGTVTDYSLWNVVRNNSCGLNCFSYYDDGSYLGNINASSNELIISSDTKATDSSSLSFIDIFYVYADLTFDMSLDLPPENSNQDSPIIFSATSKIYEPYYIQNVSLWTNYTGSWSIMNTTNYAGNTRDEITTFYNSLDDGIYKWDFQVCRNDGSCFFSNENRTLVVDSTEPSINILYPTTLLDYIYVGQEIDLNYSVTDSYTNTCWYDYNGTNYIIPSCENTSFYFEDGNKNVSIYANDTAGNQGESSLNFNIKLLEFETEYSSSVIETINQNITFVGLINDSYSLSSAKLIYDGIEYSYDSLSTNGNYNNITVNLNTPSGNLGFDSENRTFYWNITLSNKASGLKESFLTRQYNQTVNELFFGLCSSTLNVPLLNFTLYDELTNTQINSSLNFTTFLASFDIGLYEDSKLKNFSMSNTSVDKSEFDFCTKSYSTPLYINSYITFSANGYSENNYYLRNAQLDNNTNDITLYLLPESESTKFYVTVYQGIEKFYGAVVTVAKFFDSLGGYQTVSSKVTDSDGKFAIYLDIDGLYQYSITKDGTLYSIIEKSATCTTSPCELSLQIDGEQGNIWDYYTDTYSNNIVSNISFNKDTKIVTYTFLDTTGLSSYFRLVVNKEMFNTTIGTPICNTQLFSSSGSITCNLTGYDGDFIATGYNYIDSEKIDKRISIVISNLSEDLGIFGIIISLAFLITVTVLIGAVSRGNPSSILFAFGLTLLGLKLMMVLPLGWVTVSVILLGTLYLMRLSRT